MDEEEIKALQERAAKADEFEKQITELSGKVKEFEADETKVDWRKTRQVIKALKEVAEKDGRTFDEDSLQLKEAPQAISTDEITRIAKQAGEQQFIDRTISAATKSLNEEDKKTFSKFYAKAIAGEEVNGDNVDSFISMAITMASSGNQKSTFQPRGGAPVFDDGDNFADSDAGKEMMKKYFKRN